MHGLTASRSSRPGSVRLPLWLTAAVVLSGSLACDSIAGDDGPAVEGTWVMTDGTRTLYLDIRSTTVTAYEGAQGECFYVETFDRVRREGDSYTLRGELSSSNFRVTFRIEDGRLRAETVEADPTFNAVFEASDQDPSALEECVVLGTWVSGGETFIQYVHVTSSSLTIFGGLPGGCVSIVTFTIQEKNGNVYSLVEQESGQVVEVTLLLDGDQLVITNAQAPDQFTYYQPSDQDLAALEECGPRPDDPGIDCYGLPAVEPGDTIAGELTDSDGVYSGWYYDLYGLTLTASQEVQISVSSDVIDSFVGVYEEGGEYVTGNNNFEASSFDASVTFTPEAGCYRIEASSAIVGETGTYTLTVD